MNFGNAFLPLLIAGGILLAVWAVGGIILNIFRKNWKARVKWLMVFIGCVLFVFICAALLFFSNAGWIHQLVHEESYREHLAMNRNSIMALTPGVDWSKVDEPWWGMDPRFRLNRLPVRWPYELQGTDPMDSGRLFKNVAQGRCNNRDASHEMSPEISDISEYAADGRMMLFRKERYCGYW